MSKYLSLALGSMPVDGNWQHPLQGQSLWVELVQEVRLPVCRALPTYTTHPGGGAGGEPQVCGSPPKLTSAGGVFKIPQVKG